MSKTKIDKMVDRFLGWKLPEDFAPDCGISFAKFHPNGTTRFEPIGTNLLTADQARQMFEHVLADDQSTGGERDIDIDDGPDMTANVELTGAARLYRAASSDRRERG